MCLSSTHIFPLCYKVSLKNDEQLLKKKQKKNSMYYDLISTWTPSNSNDRSSAWD